MQVFDEQCSEGYYSLMFQQPLQSLHYSLAFQVGYSIMNAYLQNFQQFIDISVYLHFNFNFYLSSQKN